MKAKMNIFFLKLIIKSRNINISYFMTSEITIFDYLFIKKMTPQYKNTKGSFFL